MNRRVRPRNACWEKLSFILKKENSKNVAFCLGCKRILSNTAEERLRNHRKKCVMIINASEENLMMQLDESCQNNNDSKMSGVSFDISMSNDVMINNSISIAGPAVIPSASKRPVDTRSKITSQKALKPFLDEITEREKKSIDKALGNLLFANNIEIDVVESNYFKEFLRLIRPAYSPPTFEKVSTALLNESFVSFHMRNDESQQSSTSLGLLFLNSIKHAETNSVLAVIRDLNENTKDGLKQMAAYENGKGIFSKLFQKQIIFPSVFWNIAQQEASK
ncbi:uncharacterized protein LOC117169464 [Belonocnema kinseyi]|uniref:uncharacterized protein LOC117169464 n=1 Tax=Belonocnema kinseyi TaxID=2817044 RepID=UPI00143D8BC2|nr:uncharacterized protein LOC117169464 [Belonocnema kinseyi]